jgi:restriction system protein
MFDALVLGRRFLWGDVMGKRRGFFAELNYQAQQAEKRRRQQEAAAHRAHLAAQRQAERAAKAFERAQVAAARASAAEKKAAEREAARLHVESRLAEVESMNASLAGDLADIDGMLAWALEMDDYVDLESLKISEVEHPPFEPGRLAVPAPAVPKPDYPLEPVYEEPPVPGRLSAMFGGKKRHQQAVENARTAFADAHQHWERAKEAARGRFVEKAALRDRSEAKRLAELSAAAEKYRQECERREAEASAHNAEVAQLVNDLAFDVESAIEEYVGLVLSNSLYPEVFPVEHDHAFSLGSRELSLNVSVPEPSSMPSVKAYRYVKAKDEITSTNLPVREKKERYAKAVWQVAVRCLHEVFEADRTGKVHSIALTVGVDTVDTATGRPTTVPLVVVAADRETFNSFDLTKAIPQDTLGYLGAALSKSPFDLAPADTSRGVRVRGK